MYFRLFREHTASELSGFFDSSFWTRSVLQECHSQEAIRHSVVALGALYKTLEDMYESPPGSPDERIGPSDHAMHHWEIAFRHYSLALKTMVASTSEDQTSQRTSLMATVLLACFDSFIGAHKQAILQIQSGLRLLEKLRAERRRSFTPGPEEPVEQDLIRMFTRLAIQAKSYDMAFHFPQPFVVRLNQNTEESTWAFPDGGAPVPMNQPTIPDEFTSLIEARLVWDSLLETIMRFMEAMFQYTSTVSVSPMGVLPVSLRQYSIGFKSRIEAWSDAFEPILVSRTAPGKSSQEKAAISVLKMTQIMAQILFLMMFSDRELQFDNFVPQFKAIVNLALEVVGDEERRAAAARCPDPRYCVHRSPQPDIFGGYEYNACHIKPSFCADLGIVPPLYVVATKCRDPKIRRQAIQLLRSSSRREGMWDSELTARIGMWVSAIEEEDGDGEQSARPPMTSWTERACIGSPDSRFSVPSDSVDNGPPGRGTNTHVGDAPAYTLDSAPRRTIPEEKRVMVRAVEFDLRERVATLQCGSRSLLPGMQDLRTRVTRITW